MKVFTDRSRIEQYQRCKRSRWLGYHEQKMGIQSNKVALPLAVGGSVHEGLAALLKGDSEDAAVKIALIDFSNYTAGFELDLSERAAMQGSDVQTLEAQLLSSFSVDDRQQGEALMQMREKSINLFDKYLVEEQTALVEGLVRAYSRRRLKPLLDQYEVLEVEREGQWLLGHVLRFTKDGRIKTDQDELDFMSRPDALLLEKESRQLYIQSFKTAASWDIRKEKDAERDMQGLSEGVEVEMRLARWWKLIREHDGKSSLNEIPKKTWEYLSSLSSPPRIMGIRYEYMLKGDRVFDKDLTQEIGIDVRSQRSPLVRAYLNPGMVRGDEQWNVSWDYVKDTGEASKLYWKSWKGSPVFQHMTVKEWIDRMDQTVETVGEEGSAKGWSSPAQATGFLTGHPLEEIFKPQIIVYRNDDDLRDWFEQTEAQETAVANHVEQVNLAATPGDKRHLLNVLFPQTRKACEYPSTCSYVPVCFGGDEIRKDPLGSGKYKLREPNHPQEVIHETSVK